MVSATVTADTWKTPVWNVPDQTSPNVVSWIAVTVITLKIISIARDAIPSVGPVLGRPMCVPLVNHHSSWNTPTACQSARSVTMATLSHVSVGRVTRPAWHAWTGKSQTTASHAAMGCTWVSTYKSFLRIRYKWGSGGPLDNQTWQTEWKTAPLAKVQLCEYENQILEAYGQPFVCQVWLSSGLL